MKPNLDALIALRAEPELKAAIGTVGRASPVSSSPRRSSATRCTTTSWRCWSRSRRRLTRTTTRRPIRCITCTRMPVHELAPGTSDDKRAFREAYEGGIM